MRAYEAGEGSYGGIAARFALGEATVKRWVWRYRRDGPLAPASPASVWLCRQKKRRRPLEAARPDVRAKRHAFLTTVRRIPVERLVFLDESGM